MDERERLATTVEDPNLRTYFYLDLSTHVVLERLETTQLTLQSRSDAAPFNAQVKGYQSALDSTGDLWIVKPCSDKAEMLYHRISTLVYLLDHASGTLSAPTMLTRIGAGAYRATKVVPNAMQISSYNYLEQPFCDILRTDLVNRWLYFDEDRNPNNYLVIHTKANRQLVAAIDFDKSDLTTPGMKITGNPDKFGWFRSEKTRFLTLLKPENFEGISIDIFDARLAAFMAIPESTILAMARTLATGYSDQPEQVAQTVTTNLILRRNYINDYFRRSFKSAGETASTSHETDYSMLGASFLKMHERKK